jgi:hypothetical protein
LPDPIIWMMIIATGARCRRSPWQRGWWRSRATARSHRFALRGLRPTFQRPAVRRIHRTVVTVRHDVTKPIATLRPRHAHRHTARGSVSGSHTGTVITARTARLAASCATRLAEPAASQNAPAAGSADALTATSLPKPLPARAPADVPLKPMSAGAAPTAATKTDGADQLGLTVLGGAALLSLGSARTSIRRASRLPRHLACFPPGAEAPGFEPGRGFKPPTALAVRRHRPD